MRLAAHARLLAGLAFALATLAGCASPPPRYLMGAYRLDDGRLVSIRAEEKKDLRYREYGSGSSGRLHRHRRLRYISGAGFSSRAPVRLTVDFKVDEDGTAQRLIWNEEGHAVESAGRVGVEERVSFAAGDTSLAGRIDLPDGPGPHPAVVLVNDSDDRAATDYYYAGDFLAPNGVATLTFDARDPTRGKSEGVSGFAGLAEDVVAAVQYLHSRSDIDPSGIGLCAYGRGGWVAPLAASMTGDVSFIIINCGVVESPAEATVLKTRNLLRARGVGERALDDVDSLTSAAVGVIASGFKEWAEFDRLKNKYRDAEWKRDLKGTVTDDLLTYPHFVLKLIGPLMAPSPPDWYYNSRALLEEMDVPMAWLLAGEDESAPSDSTVVELRRMRAEGKPYEVIVFPGADHSMVLCSEDAGVRVCTGYAKDYFKDVVECARRLAGIDGGPERTAGGLQM
jgi:dienelactone hydrolase